MLFTISKEQYRKYGEQAKICRQYIIDKYPKLCEIVNTFNRFFSTEYVDITSRWFQDKSLLLKLLEDYEGCNLDLTDYLNQKFSSYSGECIFEDLAIYVWWPSVTVTNEQGQSVEVKDLYAKVGLYPNGKLRQKFQLSRATYQYEQYSSNYMHSHISGINSDPSVFMNPCLGTGPLIRTQQTLSESRNADLWDLFCVELDRYVHVESIAGTPYRYLSRIGTETMNPIIYTGHRQVVYRYICDNPPLRDLFSKFFRYVLVQKKLKFGLVEGRFICACSRTDWISKLSRLFIRFFAMMSSTKRTRIRLSILLNQKILLDVKFNDGNFYSYSSRGSGMIAYDDFINKHVLWFKGNDIKTHVDNPAGQVENTYYILHPVIALGFLDQCLNYLNIYEHEKNNNTIEETQEVSNQEGEVGNRDCSRSKNAFKDYSIDEKGILISL
jgi:hypothetical protein